MVHITALPSELLTLIVSYVDPSSWKDLRQTCRLLSYVTAQLLFESLKLYPTQASYEIMDEILTGSILEDAVKTVYINTREHPYDSDDEEEAYFPGEFENRISRLKTLSKVQNVVLQFDKRCGVSRHHWITKPPQTVAFRKKALSVLFEWLASLEAPLQSLGIQHLQDVNIKDDELSERITKVLRNLRALSLSILDLSQIHFPRLKSLVLGNFTFFQDSQLEWILSHGATLSELSLDDCMILYDLCLFEEKLDEYSFKKDEMELRIEEDGEAGYYRPYNKRWHHYFDAFR
ncbi:hypothetical protein V6Z93_002981 [Aspergillus fumigatus]